MSDHGSNGLEPWEASEVEAARREAAAIGGRAGDEGLDPAERPVIEAGGGVAEGFELVEQDLIEAASHGDSRRWPLRDQLPPEDAGAHPVYGDGDEEHSSQRAASDR